MAPGPRARQILFALVLGEVQETPVLGVTEAHSQDREQPSEMAKEFKGSKHSWVLSPQLFFPEYASENPGPPSQ